MTSQAVFDIEMLNRFIDEVGTIPLPLPAVRVSDYHGKLDVVSFPRYIPALNRPYVGPYDYWVTRAGQYYAGPYRDRDTAERAMYSQWLNEIHHHRYFIEGITLAGGPRG